MSDRNAVRQQAARAWQHWCERAMAEGIQVPTDSALLDTLERVWEASEFVARSCQQHPPLLPDLIASGDLGRPLQSGEVRHRLETHLAEVADESGLARALRLFRRREMVRIVWRDLGGLAPLAETFEALSALADACVESALVRLHRWTAVELGVPRDPEGTEQRLVVLGMGKLGACELNLSSDIDLIFAYPHDGQLGGPRGLTNEQFFIRLGQRLIQVLSAQTGDGFVFRVDARLRPFGESGPLACSFVAMEDYYTSHAREWERYAMIKARVVAGDLVAGARLMAMLRPFVYRRYLDFGAIESLREMKRLISAELHRRGMDANIKLGPGGIREIEFIGQVFQLIRGGRDPDLQIRPILQVLGALAVKHQLPQDVVEELAAAYQFLRLVENRLQAWQDRQTHLLPKDPEGRLRLARSMGFEDWGAFAKVSGAHRRRVQTHFDNLFASPRPEQQEPLAELWNSPLEGNGAAELLHAAGFPDALDALERLRQLRRSAAFRALGARGSERMQHLMPPLIGAVAAVENPNTTLERLLGLLEAIARRTAYIALLAESPVALAQLVKLASASSWIARLLTRHPLLLDELLDPRRLYAPLGRDALREELEASLAQTSPGDLEQQMERLRQFQQSSMLRVAAADIGGAIPLMVVSDYLTWTAEAITARVLDQAWRDLVGRHGRPTGVIGRETGFAIIAYGKLGGIELGYGSDLDLVFLHGSQDFNAMTDGPKPLANDAFYARLGQRIIHIFTAHTPAGVLYEVDMRLRPNGKAGLLVSSLAAFADYQAASAWTWEHQALIRARPVAGDSEVAERFEQIRREMLCRARDPGALRKDVRDMRERMRAQLDKTKPGSFDLKQGPGGIADIEFMVQYAVLRWAHKYPDLAEWTDNIRLLDTLGCHNLISGDATRRLADAYRAFRALYHRQTLQELPGLIADEELAEQRDWVRLTWVELMEAAGTDAGTGNTE